MGLFKALGTRNGVHYVELRCFKCNGIIPTLSLARFVVVFFVSLLARALFFALSALKSESMYSPAMLSAWSRESGPSIDLLEKI